MVLHKIIDLGGNLHNRITRGKALRKKAAEKITSDFFPFAHSTSPLPYLYLSFYPTRAGRERRRTVSRVHSALPAN